MAKTWLVTGANSGIGAGIVRAALAAGDQVVATGRSFEKLHAAFPDADDALALVELDVTDQSQVDIAIAKAVDLYGRLDVLVNNAGYNVLGNFEEMSNADLERQLGTNFFGVVNVIRAALPVMREQRAGHIINISSVAGVVGFKHCTAYAASKFAVEGFSQSLAAEVEPFGIHLTVVEPGFFRTALISDANAQWVESSIADYASDGTARDTWSPYAGTQQGNPDKLGKALVTIAAMEVPIKVFAAGSDALAGITSGVEERLKIMKDNAALSESTDGVD